MTTLPMQFARPAKADMHRLGRAEAERQAMLLTIPGRAASRLPGDGGQVLRTGGGHAPRAVERQVRLVWSRDN
ncbi:hypothetical protein [Roseomonas chloroacetimidivorans]|uniref:hypothetical protein n=1 Tax=Roseomonas chloroacetimidivorans TaxID=1766656 RepID=UPI003C76CBE1